MKRNSLATNMLPTHHPATKTNGIHVTNTTPIGIAQEERNVEYVEPMGMDDLTGMHSGRSRDKTLSPAASTDNVLSLAIKCGVFQNSSYLWDDTNDVAKEKETTASIRSDAALTTSSTEEIFAKSRNMQQETGCDILYPARISTRASSTKNEISHEVTPEILTTCVPSSSSEKAREEFFSNSGRAVSTGDHMSMSMLSREIAMDILDVGAEPDQVSSTTSETLFSPSKKGTKTRKHRSEASEMLLNTIVKSHLTRANLPDADGFLPIHNACRYFPENAVLLDMILRGNPDSIRMQVQSTTSDAAIGTEPARNAPAVKRLKLSVNSEYSCCRPVFASTKELKYEGAYPLHVALIHGAPIDVITLLTQAGPEVLSRTDGSGAVPLSLAFRVNASTDITEFLLASNSGAASSVDKRLNTPLHFACLSRPLGKKACITSEMLKKLVLAYSASIHFRNFDGKTPLDLVQSQAAFDDETIGYLHEMAYRDDDVQEI